MGVCVGDLNNCAVTGRIQIIEVVATAARVPTGIDFCASFKSPDRLEPAIIPK